MGSWECIGPKRYLNGQRLLKKALEIAIYLNDKYNLDGRDVSAWLRILHQAEFTSQVIYIFKPNGYVGCMWSIAGIHDQGWAERAVFGKIRYMNYEGCKRKFDITRYIAKYDKM